MIIKTKLFQKSFSAINNLQKASANTYYLTANAEQFYGIEIDCITKATIQSEYFHTVSSDKEVVIDIITFIYENAVPIETAGEIIQELIELRLPNSTEVEILENFN